MSRGRRGNPFGELTYLFSHASIVGYALIFMDLLIKGGFLGLLAVTLVPLGLSRVPITGKILAIGEIFIVVYMIQTGLFPYIF